ncbi:MAG: hypothetical protein WCB53_04925 [Terriglobales bacterium]
MGFLTVRLITVLLTVVFFLRSGATCAAEQVPRDASAVLSKAAQVVDLQSIGGAPFLLLANVVLHEGQKDVAGVYGVTWAGPGQYRRVLQFPNFSATEVVTGGFIYRQRSTDAPPLIIWELDELLSPASQYRLDGLAPQAKVQRVQSEQTGGTELTCVLTQVAHGHVKLCVDAATGKPFSIDRGADAGTESAMREHFEFADFQPFEGRAFPHKFSFRGWDSRTIEVQVQRLVRVHAFAADEFTPPKGATPEAFCEEPQTTGELNPSSGGTIPIGFRNIEEALYFRVNPSGGVRYAQALYSSAPLQSKEIISWFIGTRFPVESCAGNPVPYEMVILFATGH